MTATGRRTGARRGALWIGLATGGAACLAFACGSWPGRGEAPKDAGPIAATVGDESIPLAEVDERIRQELFDDAFGDDASRLYAARRETVDEMINERLLRSAAEAAGQTPEAWLEAAVRAKPPVTDEEVVTLFEDNRDRLPAEATIDAYRDQLRAYLERGRLQEVVADLRADAQIALTVPRERVEVEAAGPSLGPADAPITIVEFSDFQCPFCARAAPTVKALHERFPEDVRIVYRHLPLGFHPQARIAAIASACADSQQAFWPFHDRLFERQDALERADLIAHAEALELDVAVFEACLDDPATAAVVEADAAAAAAVGATGTPTFFVNGIRLTGAQPIERFEALIEEERAGSPN